MLNARQRSFLKAMAHHLEPVVLVGKNGVTDAVINETKHALLAHELIKVRMRGTTEPDNDAQRLADGSSADLVAVRGNIAMLYVAHPEKPRISLPR